ncbi:hypothetical protein ACWGPW_24440 [Paenibacillus chitinolyticus]
MLFKEDTVRYICDKVLKDSALDVFYIIFAREGGISKIDILRDYQMHQGIDPTSTASKKFRYTIDEALALLCGTTFVDFYPDGTSQKYYLTSHGEIAADLLGELIREKPDLLKTSKVVSKIMRGA